MMEKWIAVYTKSRHEKVVIQELENKNIESYCPIFKERRQWSDRKRWVEFPLFRSYVFAKIELKNSIYILQTMGVHHIIKFQGNISIIPDEIIQNIKNMIDAGQAVDRECSCIRNVIWELYPIWGREDNSTLGQEDNVVNRINKTKCVT